MAVSARCYIPKLDRYYRLVINTAVFTSFYIHGSKTTSLIDKDLLEQDLIDDIALLWPYY